jgi:hypothetical protein
MLIWIRIKEHGNWPKFTNKPGFLPVKRYDFLSYFKYIFHVNIQPFVTQKSGQDVDADPPGSALVWFYFASIISIRSTPL